MQQVIQERQIIEAVAFAAGWGKAVWSEEGRESEFVPKDGDKTSNVWEVARGQSRFLPSLQLAFTQPVSLPVI